MFLGQFEHALDAKGRLIIPSKYRDEIGEQKKEYAIDGVHMVAEAYRVIFENLKPFLPL